MMPFWRQACGLSLRCRWYMSSRHSSLLFTFYKAQKYKDFLKRQNVSTFFYQFNQKKSRRARALRDERYVNSIVNDGGGSCCAMAAGETPTLPEACGYYSTAIFMLSLPILATTIEPDCAAKDVVPLMAVAEPRALPSMP